MTITLEDLKERVSRGDIDTVAIGCVDMQGRLIGKRLTGHYFLDHAKSRMAMSYYHLVHTIEGLPADGYEIANWQTGFSNCAIVADLGTLRPIPWMEGTALVIADPVHPESGEPVYCSPRTMLRQQLGRLAGMGLKSMFASELEFNLFSESQESARKKCWKELETAHPHWQWMNLQTSSQTEPFMRRVRNGLKGAGIPLEATHPEWGPSQQELNFVPAEALEMADRHILTKQGIHEMAKQAGLAATFMAKYNTAKPGSSCHIHLSLLHSDTGKSAFYDPNDEFGMSSLMRHWLAGLIKYAPEYLYFLAPYVNSYKRLQPNTFAPTKCCWALDNRTSAFRVCNQRSAGVHVEIRIGGADLNPYLAFSAIIGAGMAGIEEELELGPPCAGNLYEQKELPELPHTLLEAIQHLATSKMLPKALGEKAWAHYLNGAQKEQAEFEKQVTDWELMRGFDRC